MNAISEPDPRLRIFEVATVAVLLLGWLVPAIGALVGITMLWASNAWSPREKAIGMLTPVAATAIALVVVFAGSTQKSSGIAVALISVLLVVLAVAALGQCDLPAETSKELDVGGSGSCIPRGRHCRRGSGSTCTHAM